MKAKCNNTKRYKGLQKPKCCGGEGCRACWYKYLKTRGLAPV